MKFGMEFGRRPEISPEIIELQSSPEMVFDSDLDTAENQWQQVRDRLQLLQDTQKSGNHAEIECVETKKGKLPIVKIAWPGRTDASKPHLLTLNPTEDGYMGEYGEAKKEGGRYSYSNEKKRVSLERLFNVPEGIELIVKPTIDRWAIETKEPPQQGKDRRILYVGLGFLMLGNEWMHIGMHEAGHLPNNRDENQAWHTANKNYADRHKPKKKEIIAGKNTGDFDLLKNPVYVSYGKTPTVGRVTEYGLVSHFRVNNAKIPKQWEKRKDKTGNDFSRVIMDANLTYDYFIGR